MRVLLFKPVINSLKERRNKRELLEIKIKNNEKNLLKMKNEKKEDFLKFQNHIKETYPFDQEQIISEESEESTAVEKELDKKNIKKESIELLVSKVPDAY